MTAPLRVGIAGLGTVGAGTARVLAAHRDEIARRAGRAIDITAVSARDRDKDRGVDLSAVKWLDDPLALAADPDVDVVAELIGGADGVAKALCEAAIASGKHVVTANKALIAHHGQALATAAEARGVALAFEAAVAGGIPILKGLREGLAANAVSRVYGILNGTCNYILTEMRDTGREFADVLAEAQAEGYAEADPSFDIDGVDAAHKLAILAALAFGTQVDFKSVHAEGIRHVSPVDLAYARELGFGIKLLGIATNNGAGVEQRVHPCMVPLDAPINHVDGVFNAVVAEGDFVDRVQMEGRGAGAGPTASAVVADIIDIARGNMVPGFARPAADLEPPRPVPMSAHKGCYYLRFEVVDKPGVFAGIAQALGRHNVSMESIIQRARDPGEPVPVVMTTHDTLESDMTEAVAAIAALDAVVMTPRIIRIEDL
ncbi:MAG: homoserine dehydrogenase [Rhodospirillales bacterium CG15_BIG_FIL_POST_REV_8_21_14_020_66_15]|nr:MAG: homoserine dehydrogenase [Rhodospirillales bacterium CG15_BIG_FIL_POST_REV_8_21_14_020_66_15]